MPRSLSTETPRYRGRGAGIGKDIVHGLATAGRKINKNLKKTNVISNFALPIVGELADAGAKAGTLALTGNPLAAKIAGMTAKKAVGLTNKKARQAGYGEKPKKTSQWIEFVREYSDRHQCSYGEAMKLAKPEYEIYKKTGKMPRKPRKRKAKTTK
jgi:hypothetical protein